MKKLYVALVAIVTLALLGGCSMIEKNSRGWIEDQVASSVERVYPTENLFDLFEKFPDGFRIRSTYRYKDEPKTSYWQRIELVGDKESKTIKGTLKNAKTPGDNEAETILAESQIEYTNQGYVVLNGDLKVDDIYFDKFLFQSLTLDKDKLASFDMTQKAHSFENDHLSIDYNVSDNTINNFLDLSKNSEVNLYIGKSSERSRGYALQIRKDNLRYYESVGE